MQIEREHGAGFSVLWIKGAVSLGESGRQVSDALREELASGAGHVLLEMSGIDYMDSTGVGELVGYLTRLADVQADPGEPHPPDPPAAGDRAAGRASPDLRLR